jgi:hypothetical protein
VFAALSAGTLALVRRTHQGDRRTDGRGLSGSVIRIIDRRCRLLGLYGTKRTRPRFDTLVIGEEGNPREATDERPETAGEATDRLPAA